MEIVLALLADCANVSREGKLNILGIFERIYAQSIPVTHPQMHLILTIEAERVEADREHRIEVELIDADGKKLVSIGGNLKFGPPPPGEKVKLNHIIQLNNLRFEHLGSYEFKILLNNEVRKTVPMSVIEIKKS